MVQYRLLTVDELPCAVRLWEAVFDVEARYFQSLLDAGDLDDFSLGAFEGDELVSSVHVFMRWFRNREGLAQKVGGIGSVCTLSDHRRAGHSSHLLGMAIDEMALRGCVWSYLGTGSNHHYARMGWRTVSTPYFRGVPRAATFTTQLEATPVTDLLISQMTEVFDAYHCTRPMANRRSCEAWFHAVHYRITQPTDEVFTVFNGPNLVAYLVSRRKTTAVELVEAACLAGFEDGLNSLIRRRMALATDQGISSVISHLAQESPAHAAFVEGCSQLVALEDCSWMVRPIADQMSLADVVTIHADPRGRRSELDNF